MFITIEGPDGSGKSTLINSLKEKFSAVQKPVLFTREPGATEIGKKIRALLLDAAFAPAPLTELLLFAADRAEHVETVIRPALAKSTIVICDRFTHSTLAYQGYGRGVSLDTINRINAIATSGLTPDCVLLLDLPVEVGLARASKRTTDETWTRFEEQEMAFHKKLREGFLEMAKMKENKFHIIDATQAQENVFRDAWAVIEKLIP